MEWKEVTLGEVSSKIGDGLHGTPKYDDEGSYYFINGNNLNCGKIIIKDDTKRVGIEEFVKNQKELNEQTILVSINGTIGNVAKYNNEPCILGKSACYINVIKEVDKEFIYYILTSANFKRNITNEATGTTIKNVSLKQMREYKFNIPCNLADQRRIASILSSLDRKIELNNKINADLEEMAQAIFKNWFVDFEPFKDGKFVDSELGMIPEGWTVGSYSEMIESLISGDWGKETPQGNYTHEVACVRGCDFQDINNGVRGKTPQRYILEKNYQAKHLKDKDILVEISGGTATVSTGRTSLVTEELLKKYKHDIVCTNFCKVLRPLSQFSSYVYYSWKYKYDNDIMFGYENGTSGIKNFAIKDFIEKEPVLIPKEQDIVEFQKIIDNLQKQKQIKGTENTTLSTLRDTLLPRLMSGEIEVPE